MTTHQPDQSDPVDTIVSGTDTPRRSGRVRGSLQAVAAALALVVAVATGVALAGDGADTTEPLALAAAGSASPSADDDGGDGRADGFRGRGHAFGRGFGHGRMGGPGRGALHGTFVVPDADGGYRTVVSQRGEVTAVSDTSLTVRSEDGFVATYRLTDATNVLGGAGGVADIAEGDQVGVGADRKASVNTARHVVDLDRRGDPRQRST
ncbi:MAG: hypothetical protein LH461_00900 [Spirochaetaceae bacterium]|nr:hypothetical protein [Spirochaetaceae bacterium]